MAQAGGPLRAYCAYVNPESVQLEWPNRVAAATILNSEFSSGATIQQAFDALAGAGFTSPNYPSSTPGYTAAVTASYTGTGQLNTLSYGTNYQPYTETRGYNSLLQLTSMVTNGGTYSGCCVSIRRPN